MTNNNSYQDLYNLQRFVDAQEKVYKTVIDELKMQKKAPIGCGLFFLKLMV